MLNERQLSPLAGFGVDGRGDRIYRVLLREGALSVPDLAERLGWSATEVEAQLGALIDLGLVARRGDEVGTVAPHLALGRLVDREARAIGERERDLDVLRAAIRDYAAEEHGGTTGGGALQPLEVHTGAAIGTVVDALARSTTGPILLIHTVEWLDDPGWSKFDTLLPWEAQGGRPTRSIYPAEVLHRPEQLTLVRRFAEIGEDVRLMTRPPSRLIVFGQQAALVPVEWGSTPLRRVVVRTPGVVVAMGLLFDLLWRAAVPLPGEAVSGADPTDARTRILQLLAAGAKDETIARHLGLSLRTVRRRVADLMVELGANTRFQAGAEAVRRQLV